MNGFPQMTFDAPRQSSLLVAVLLVLVFGGELPAATVRTWTGAGLIQFIDNDVALHPMRFYRIATP